MAGDGQVSMGETVVKSRAAKVRSVHHGEVLAGFAGSTADALALFTRFEQKLKEHRGNLAKAAVEMAKEWRTDRALRRLEALLVVADRSQVFLLSGTGDVIEPDDGVIAVGSGGPVALAAARALLAHTELEVGRVAAEALSIAADIDVYTNHNLVVEEL
jgi:ATP-dependent HslUV protease subunit HslV